MLLRNKLTGLMKLFVIVSLFLVVVIWLLPLDFFIKSIIVFFLGLTIAEKVGLI